MAARVERAWDGESENGQRAGPSPRKVQSCRHTRTQSYSKPGSERDTAPARERNQLVLGGAHGRVCARGRSCMGKSEKDTSCWPPCARSLQSCRQKTPESFASTVAQRLAALGGNNQLCLDSSIMGNRRRPISLSPLPRLALSPACTAVGVISVAGAEALQDPTCSRPFAAQRDQFSPIQEPSETAPTCPEIANRGERATVMRARVSKGGNHSSITRSKEQTAQEGHPLPPPPPGFPEP